VTDQYGNLVADGTTVAFTTTLGVISPLTTTTANGEATAALTSGSAAGTAVVTAQADSHQGQTTVVFLPADLAIHKGVTPIEAIPGQTLTYVLSYANWGAATARGVVITDELDSRLISPSYVASGATITRTGSITYAWRVEDLSPGEGGTITITAQLDPGIIWPPSENLWNVAVITTTTAEGGPGPNGSTGKTDVLTADLYVTKEIEGGSFRPGGWIRYRIGFGNTGWADAQGIRITDTLPLGTTWDWDESEQEGLSRSIVGRQVVWTREGPVGANEYFRLWVDIADDAPGGLVLTNAITATTSTPESDYSNNRCPREDCQPIAVVQGVNLSIAKEAPAEIKPGRRITYTIVYSNTGTETAQNVVITDTLSPGVSFVGASPSPSGGSGLVRYWSVGPLEPEARGTIRLTGLVTTELPAGQVVVNLAEIGTTTAESYLLDNYSSTRTLIIPDVSHTVTVQTEPESIPADGLSTAVITATVRDQYDNPVADGTPVAFTTTLGVITPTLATTSQGVATATLTAGTVAGTAIVTATADSRVGSAQVALLPGPPSALTLAVHPTSLPADGVSTAAITATVQDQYDNLVADGTPVAFTTTLGVITPTLAATSQGVATATLTSGTHAGTVMVTAQAGSAITSTTVAFLPGPPFTVTVTAGSGSLPVGGFSTVVTVTVTDRHDNPVADETPVALTATLGAITPTWKTTQGGLVTATLTSGTVVGTALVTATADARVGSAQVVFLPGPPHTFAVTAHPLSLPPDGTSTAAITVTAQDEYGNPVADDTVVTFTTSLGTFLSGSVYTTTTTGGVATALLTSATEEGTAIVTVVVDSIPTPRTVEIAFMYHRIYLPLIRRAGSPFHGQ
ncbi:MAG TPA: DUF11 domain-containing protein, partial [Anaerolineae bacterium]|nr:DUF11 domain-containing protein [Anaerolineae bacterium]